MYAVEASGMSNAIKDLADGNAEVGHKVKVLHKTLETVTVDPQPGGGGGGYDLEDGKVDVLVSEPIGTFLFNERMIETYLFARDKFLKPGGKMYPNRSRLYLAPFTDATLFNDVATRGQFWKTTDFYGLSLESAASRASEEHFRQPIIDYINPAILLAEAHVEDFDFTTIKRSSLENMKFAFEFTIATPALVHGIAGWFDIFFDGSLESFVLSTAPTARPTHWYQIRFLFIRPLAVNPSQRVTGTLTMTGNAYQSYHIDVEAAIDGTDIATRSVTLDLKDPDYRYHSNPAASYTPPTPETE